MASPHLWGVGLLEEIQVDLVEAALPAVAEVPVEELGPEDVGKEIVTETEEWKEKGRRPYPMTYMVFMESIPIAWACCWMTWAAWR